MVEVYFAPKSLIYTNVSTRVTILLLLGKFRETGSVQDKHKGHSG